ncbi:MAG: SDR family oxidoreductase [Ignavibacteria bacterium]|nr:SDR family oxidoreductase [Ignavibacteria bacterium]
MNLNKVAMVTGSARRLGRDIALRLADLGFDMVVNYHSSDENAVKNIVDEITSKGVKALAVKADLRKIDSIKDTFAEIKKTYGCLDVLVNNSAIFGHVDFFDITEDIFYDFIDSNLKSTLFCSIEAAKLMKDNPEKPCSIINISSLGGIQNWQGFIPYSLAKTGVIKLTKLMAKRLAPDILVNSIAPGTIWIDDDENKTANRDEEKLYPMKRFGKSEDINGLIEFLSINNKYITGNIFIVDGGRSL